MKLQFYGSHFAITSISLTCRILVFAVPPLCLSLSLFSPPCFQGSHRPATPFSRALPVRVGLSAMRARKTIPTAQKVQVFFLDPTHTLLLGPFTLFPPARPASPLTTDKPSPTFTSLFCRKFCSRKKPYITQINHSFPK